MCGVVSIVLLLEEREWWIFCDVLNSREFRLDWRVAIVRSCVILYLAALAVIKKNKNKNRKISASTFKETIASHHKKTICRRNLTQSGDWNVNKNEKRRRFDNEHFFNRFLSLVFLLLFAVFCFNFNALVSPTTTQHTKNLSKWWRKSFFFFSNKSLLIWFYCFGSLLLQFYNII